MQSRHQRAVELYRQRTLRKGFRALQWAVEQKRVVEDILQETARKLQLQKHFKTVIIFGYVVLFGIPIL